MAGPGRPKGSLSASTLLARDNLITAVEVCRQGNLSPPEFLREAFTLIRTIALAPVSRERDREKQAELLNSLPENVKDKIINRIVKAAGIAATLMEYGYPKLARVEHTGADGGAIEAGVRVQLEVVYVDPRETVVEHVALPGPKHQMQ